MLMPPLHIVMAAIPPQGNLSRIEMHRLRIFNHEIDIGMRFVEFVKKDQNRTDKT